MISWLYGLQHFGVKLGLHNISSLLRVLGRPDAAYPSMLIAGTNGKGSVAAMVEAMLHAAGVRTGLFTSPHLVRPNERIRIDGRDIESDELDRQLAAMRDCIDAALRRGELDAHPSFFEVITATALQSFKDHGVDAAILEVGLGGRLDATNAVDADVAVIVSIALDHTKTLGPTLGRIATEKAGIVKQGKPLISGVVQQPALDVIRAVCRRSGSRFVDARSRVQLIAESDGEFTLEGRCGRYPDLRTSLAGRHQIDNARVALAAVESFGPALDASVTPHAVRRGLAETRWNGRLQWIDGRPGRPAMLLDGAHNPAGVMALANHLRERGGPKPVLLFGATRGKPVTELVRPLSDLVREVVVTRPPVDKGLDPTEVADEIRPVVPGVVAVDEIADAVDEAGARIGDDTYVLVTGSLYLVGHVLGLLEGRDVPGPVAM